MMRDPIPLSALVLGWMGVIPFAGLALAAAGVIALPFADPVQALIAYAAAILSFMAGVQWGIGVMSRDGQQGVRFALSVMPALLAWACLLVAPKTGLAGLTAGFVSLLAYDLWTVQAGDAPDWYGRLRLQLTAAVVTTLAAALIFG
jgi:hypothetical protein